MKKYNAPSLEAFELEVTDTITASGGTLSVPRFVEATETGVQTAGSGQETWSSAWDVN